MRLFTGIDLPAELVESLERLLNKLRPAAHIQWSPPENLHITTKFIGQWPDEKLEELTAQLRQVKPRPPIPLNIRRVGFFPNPHAPRVFWCGIEAPGLGELANETDMATAALGIPKETRDFSPHLTLARIKERLNLQPLREAIAALHSLDFGHFEADRFFLYQSRPGRAGSVYTKLAEFLFTRS
jgi:2'-5' RNA ligase